MTIFALIGCVRKEYGASKIPDLYQKQIDDTVVCKQCTENGRICYQ